MDRQPKDYKWFAVEAATGYDRRGILALAAALAAMGIAGTAYIVNKSFGGKEV